MQHCCINTKKHNNRFEISVLSRAVLLFMFLLFGITLQWYEAVQCYTMCCFVFMYGAIWCCVVSLNLLWVAWYLYTFIFICRGRIGFFNFCLLVGGLTAGVALLHQSTVLQSCIYLVFVEINLCDKSSPYVCCLCMGGSGLYSFGE